MLNLEGSGRPVCRIVGKGKGKGSKVIYVTDDENNVINCFKMIGCKEDEHMQQIPNFISERDVLYIAGQSGSGKSYYLKNFCKQYNAIFPDRSIYLLSPVQNDISLDGIKNVKRINIDTDEFLEIDLECDDFKESLVAFDDCDSIKDKPLRRKIDAILSMLLNRGRHTKTTVVYISHLLCNGQETKQILNEAHSITIFPKSLGGRALKYLLENYLCLDKNQIDQIKNLNSRHVTVCKTYPTSIIYDKGIYLLN